MYVMRTDLSLSLVKLLKGPGSGVGQETQKLGVQVDYIVVHLRTSLVQIFVLLLQNLKK
jgi:hypothetical protein